MKNRKLLLLLILLAPISLLLTAPVIAEEAAEAKPVRDAKAVEIVEKADAATKKVSAVAFECSMEPFGAATNFVQAVTGKGVISGWNGQIPDYFHLVVSLEQGGQTVKYEGGGNPESYFLIDHSTKKGYEDMDPNVMGSAATVLQTAVIMEYVNPKPFDDELAAESLIYKGKVDVEGTSCHEIDVVYSGGNGESTWYFGEEDFLPRRRVRHFNMPQGKGGIDIRFFNIEADPELDNARFSMKLPEGYEQVDDFAP